MTNTLRTPCLLLFLSILASSLVTASLDCEYDPAPDIKGGSVLDTRIYWICADAVNLEYSCYSYLEFDNTVFQTNPIHQYNEQTGNVVDSFESQSGIVKPYFRQLDLIHNQTVTFGVACSSGESFEANVTPEYAPLGNEAFEAVEYWQFNKEYIVLGVIILVVVILLGVFMFRVATQ